jgi:hypothetical protein
VFDSAVNHRHRAGERSWTEHLATDVGALALLGAVREAPLPPRLVEAVDELRCALAAGVTRDDDGDPLPRPTHLVAHQLHLGGRFPDLAVYDVRDQLLAVVEAQRGRADDHHLAKLAAAYVPQSGARLGVLVAEAWAPALARHPAWAVCPEPVVVVLALDGLHSVDYRAAWTHHPA